MFQQNLYALPIDGARFTTYCGGNLGGDNETCAEVAPIPGVADAYVVRDNKQVGAGSELRLTGGEMDNLALGWVRDRGLTA
ncbi:DUF397 domain-containing protein [Micromonospora craniellae]|uniref:DUF397 domain-containing protein n=1 Tax=Micromonospora craniellae TaxID=2294034 RepID=A0A372G1J6_9ACTN|nr:DUF397 domain-containing protein [Micromonospora craniellae]QOC92790.1 DUF397 domain-containing protein [Micromonospora craniellae]RFS46937.1 DUF397 domain-containing protein [Micromonospora craniellae]